MTIRVNVLEVLRTAIKAVPSVKYALGVSGVISIIPIIALLKVDLLTAGFGFIVIFSKFIEAENSLFRWPSKVMVESFLLILVTYSVFIFTSTFFNWPLPLRENIGIGNKSTQGM